MKRVSNLFKVDLSVRHPIMDRISPYVTSLEVFQTEQSSLNSFKVRLAERTDLPTLVELEQKGYQGYIAWELSDFERDWQRNPQLLYLILEENNSLSGTSQVVGMITGRFLLKHSHISQLVIDPQWQSKGLGSYLLKVWLQASRELSRKSVTLEVRESNLPAKKLYFDHGFIQETIKPFYYEDNGESALYLRCRL